MYFVIIRISSKKGYAWMYERNINYNLLLQILA